MAHLIQNANVSRLVMDRILATALSSRKKITPQNHNRLSLSSSQPQLRVRNSRLAR